MEMNTADITNCSPRKLQDMALTSTEGHDNTVASGISLKQHEEQLIGLRKENFHLKLRIYFLEEKLGNGAPPAMQGLLEHNVRLQVEVEELKRQLTDKQELLAAAAEAIDVLEHQGSLSSDSLEVKNATTENVMECQNADKENIILNSNASEQKPEPAVLEHSEHQHAVNLEDVLKLRKENRRALHVIKDCMKRIQMQNNEIRKLKLDKEMIHAQIDSSQIQKYVEMLKSKDEKINELENKLNILQNRQNSENEGSLQQMLTRRLQGLAYFLDKLLAHKCVLSEDKKRMAESILEQSLSLPVGLHLDELVSPEEFALEESNMDVSHFLKIDDLTMMFGHHNIECNESECGKNAVREESKSGFLLKPILDKSDKHVLFPNTSFSEKNTNIKDLEFLDTVPFLRRHSNENKNTISESDIIQENCDLKKQISSLEQGKQCNLQKLEFANIQINDLNVENENLRIKLANESSKVEQFSKEIQSMKENEFKTQHRLIELEKQLVDATKAFNILQLEKQEMESTFLETERSLKRAADEAAVQASESALERARAQHDKSRLERELEEVREKLVAALDANAQFEMEITRQASLQDYGEYMNEPQMSDDERPTSPDQGIDSDRLSSLDHNDAMQLSPRLLYEENINLKQKLARTKVTLAETLAQLNAANMKKRSVQRAICREIHKTNGVLRKAREKLENQDQLH